jgi:hypothetical protein
MKRTTYIFALLLGVTTSPLFGQIPNAGFEAWDSLTLVNNIRIYNPTDWNGSNIDFVSANAPQTVEMTTDAHSGKYAVKLTSAINDEQRQATYLNSGYNIGESPDDPLADKFPLKGRINGFEGYYKYVPHHEDSFQVFLALYRDGIYIGQSFIRIATPTNSYTKFWHPVNFPATMTPPDSAIFIIEPSIEDGGEGSVLYLDDMKITYGFTMGTEETPDQPEISLFPNPATDEMTLLGYNPKRPYGYHLTGIDGKIIQSGTLTDNTLDVNFLQTGLYILTLINDEGLTSKHKFVKQ